jgi:hypothetical protein
MTLLLLVACDSDKNAFMTPSPNELVVDVGIDEYSVNGTVVGKTATDILASEDLLIKPLEEELKKIQTIQIEQALRDSQPFDWETSTAKLHVDENLSFDDFYKTIATTGFVGYPNIKYVIGSDFKNVYNLKLPTKSSMCFCSGDSPMLPFLRYKYMRHRQKLSFNEILALREGGNLILECFEDYNDLDFLLTFFDDNNERVYVVSLNEDALKENSSFHEFAIYTFKKEVDLWKFLGEITSRAELQKENKAVKCSYDLLGKQVTLIFPKDVLMKDIAPLIKGLNAYGYKGDKINFMKVN